ncbi:MAG: hypothetical protein C0601_07945 [Candidatus Muiribacterium halophilum]|uniref:HEAT repeat domain-containing protein n=1 Tax=Muiribacterium halophilum TaxID=2053465 RepID=A0A2N5ZF57_MUIH1|nr:MAG: hypothetical protein C0601_07945 [Candidatus Muirbacterium halophilum]
MNLQDKIFLRFDNIFKGKEPFDRDFVKQILNEDIPNIIKAAALVNLGKYGEESDVFIIIDKIKSDDQRLRINAIKALVLSKSPLVYAFLLDYIGDEENKISEFSLKYCLKEDFQKTFEYTEIRVKNSKDINTLKRILKAFSTIQHDEARRFKVFINKHIKRLENTGLSPDEF